MGLVATNTFYEGLGIPPSLWSCQGTFSARTSLGTIGIGSEVQFKIYIHNNHRWSYQTVPGNAWVTQVDATTAQVSFEDFGGGSGGDVIIQVRNPLGLAVEGQRIFVSGTPGLLAEYQTKLLVEQQSPGEPTQEQTIAALREGKAVATTSPDRILQFSVSGTNGTAGIGDELAVTPGEVLTVSYEYAGLTPDQATERLKVYDRTGERLGFPLTNSAGQGEFTYTASDSTHLRLAVISDDRNQAVFTNPVFLVAGVQPPEHKTDVALIIDGSLAMATADPTGIRKAEAQRLVDEAYARDSITVVEIGKSPTVHAGLTQIDGEAQRTVLKDAVALVDDKDKKVDLGAAIEAAYFELMSAPDHERPKAAILLTDGGGLYKGEAIFFADQGWPVYPIAVGDDNSALLQQIASETGGEYFSGLFPFTLPSIYAQLTGDVELNNEQTPVLPGETVDIPVDVASGTLTSRFAVQWEGSTVGAALVSPSGQVVAPSTDSPRVQYASADKWATFRLANPEAGTWTLRLEGTDVPAGGEAVNVVASALEQTPPDVAFSPDAPPEGIVSGTVMLEASAQDADGVSSLGLDIAGTPMVTLPDVTSVSYSWDTTAGPDGRYSVSAVAQDTYRSEATVRREVVVDNVVPVADAGPYVVINVGQPAAFDASGSVDVSYLGYHWDFGDGAVADYVSDYTEHTYVTPGTYTATLTVYDDAGNLATDTTTVYVRGDNPPSVSIVSPPDGSTVSGEIIIQVQATDDVDPDEDLQVDVSVDSLAWQAATYDPGSGYYELSWDTTQMQSGSHTVDARVSDSWGNVTDATPVTVAIADQAPTLTIIAPENGTTVEGTVTIQVDATDDIDAVGTLAVDVRIDGGSWLATTFDGVSGVYRYDWDSTGATDGTHSIEARAVDSASNETISAPITITVDNDQPPAVAVVSPADGTTVEGTVTIQVDATDDVEAVGTLAVDVRIDGGSWLGTTFDGVSGVYRYDWDSTGATDGTHSIEARAVDSASNETISAPITITVDNDQPPVVAIMSPADGTTVEGTVTIQVDATDDVDAVGTLSVEVTINGGAPFSAAYDAASGLYKYTWDTTTVSDGPNVLVASATDSKLQASESSPVTVTVSNGALAAIDTGTDYPISYGLVAGSAGGDGYIYGFGGFDAIFFSTDAIVRFDPATAEATVLSTKLPSARRAMAAALADNGKVYIGGGQESGFLGPTFFSDIYEFDPVAETITKVADLPSGRSNFTAVSLGDRILFIGGNASGTALAEIVEFHCSTYDVSTWSGVMPSGRYNAFADQGGDGMVYVFGGNLGHPNYTDEILQLDPADQTVTELQVTMPRPQVADVSRGLDGGIYLMGGYYYDGSDHYTAEIYRFDPSTATLTLETATLPSTRVTQAVGLHSDGTIYLMSGDHYGQVDANIYAVTP